MGVLATVAPLPPAEDRKPKVLEFSTQDALKLRALKALAVSRAPSFENKILPDSVHSTSSSSRTASTPPPTNETCRCSTELVEAKRRILELGESYRLLIHDEKEMAKTQTQVEALTKEVPMLMGSYVTAYEPSDASTIESQPSLQLLELASSFSNLFS